MRRPRPEPGPAINERLLRIPEVRLVGNDGSQLGVMPTREALEKAKEAGLDLVMVAEKAVPPVCKIVDFGKHKYEQSKLKKDKKPKGQEVKGIKVSPNIAEHDLGVQIRKTRQFLEDGDKVRVVCRFRQRELQHPENGRRKLDTLIAEVADLGKPDKEPVLSGREMTVVINPKPAGGKTKDGKDENKQDGGEEV
ncbi:MAG: translation initiation factor IF-3 [Fimbriimonadaceae bacterium]|nr:translation initiation factor IF-3 [Fimbriimonadaceae bacterium]QYK59583.1 MAG: translation initiation factor IF-3 [Fimbriimonadaceae bacterium]